MAREKNKKNSAKSKHKPKEEKNERKQKINPFFYKPILAIAGIILVAAIAFFAYNFVTAKTVAQGDLVSVDYTAYFEDGTLFDTTIATDISGGFISPHVMEPISFTVGAKEVLPGLDEAVIGMKEGEQKTVLVPPAKAFGERDPNNVIAINKTEFVNKGIEPKIGLRVSTSNGEGIITQVDNKTVAIDLNNEFVGKTFNFKIIVRKITKGN